jgi:broad specificity phosphatase PhoE
VKEPERVPDGCSRAHGADLLRTIAGMADRPEPLAVLLRHSARGRLSDTRSSPLVPLSDEGRAAARAFGRGLPTGRRVVLRHSWVERCRETADLIAEGYREAGGRAEVAGADGPLGASYVRDLDALASLADTLGRGFVRPWLDGTADPAVIAPPAEAAAGMTDRIVRLLADSAPGDLHLLVTHDWNVLVVREVCLGVRHEDAGWADYLDGVVFRPDGGGVEAIWRDRRVSLG